MRAGEKICDREVLRGWAERQRAAGRTIVLANGIFDLLHVGHLRYLEEAAALADRLVVAVNGDAAARSLKGAGRPVVPGVERAELLAGLGCVDRVVLIDDLDMVPLIALLRPDVHAKGTDYTTETVPERDAVHAHGGRVAITGDPKDHDATALIRKIRGDAS